MHHLILALALAAQALPTSNLLTWVDSDAGVTFTVWRSTTGCSTTPGSFSSIATGVTALTYTDANLNPGTVYSYQVTAVRTSDGVSSTPSNCVTVILPPPAAPTGLTVKSQ